MTVMEILLTAGVDTMLGMGIVFLILMLISFVIYLFKFLPDKKNTDKTTEEMSSKEERDLKSEEITAVIGAAITAFSRERTKKQEVLDPDEYIVRTIRKRGK